MALPDLRGRVPLHFGQGVGLTPRDLGEAGQAAMNPEANAGGSHDNLPFLAINFIIALHGICPSRS